VSDTVLLERAGAVATITINRPEGMNALTDEVKTALLTAVAAVRDDDAVRALVLTGSGRAFCVGQDLREHAGLLEAGDPAPLSTVREHYNPLVTMLASLPKPTVAAVNGSAAGAGLGLACICDFRIAATGARWTTAFAGIGLTADSGLSWSLPRLVGAGRAGALLLLAEPFTTEQALDMGMVNAVVAPDQVVTVGDRARDRAWPPGRPPPTPASSSRWRTPRTPPWSTRSPRRTSCRRGPAAPRTTPEPVRSFLAKEVPVFTGR
jgi:2-(1,2-epoxy-1,2-dihydrophenyl)acetyl-CoA isomerase